MPEIWENIWLYLVFHHQCWGQFGVTKWMTKLLFSTPLRDPSDIWPPSFHCWTLFSYPNKRSELTLTKYYKTTSSKQVSELFTPRVGRVKYVKLKADWIVDPFWLWLKKTSFLLIVSQISTRIKVCISFQVIFITHPETKNKSTWKSWFGREISKLNYGYVGCAC